MSHLGARCERNSCPTCVLDVKGFYEWVPLKGFCCNVTSAKFATGLINTKKILLRVQDLLLSWECETHHVDSAGGPTTMIQNHLLVIMLNQIPWISYQIKFIEKIGFFSALNLFYLRFSLSIRLVRTRTINECVHNQIKLISRGSAGFPNTK